MNEAKQDLCTCNACPGLGCTCGCQETAVKTSCGCGPTCGCGDAPHSLQLGCLVAFALGAELPYDDMRSLSFESRQKLAAIRPSTLAQAARIPGVSPTDLQNLVLEIEKRKKRPHMAPGD